MPPPIHLAARSVGISMALSCLARSATVRGSCGLTVQERVEHIVERVALTHLKTAQLGGNQRPTPTCVAVDAMKVASTPPFENSASTRTDSRLGAVIAMPSTSYHRLGDALGQGCVPSALQRQRVPPTLLRGHARLIPQNLTTTHQWRSRD
jgi:hypothetical protein